MDAASRGSEVAEIPGIRLDDVRLSRGCALGLVLHLPTLRKCYGVDDARAAIRAVLCLLLARLKSCAPGSLQFEWSGDGKPYLAGSDPIAFSISHARVYSLIALSWGSQIGCDIEDRFDRDDARPLHSLILHPQEMEALNRLDVRHRRDAFGRYWVRKEAALKALGAGFLKDPKAIVVGLDNAQTDLSGMGGARLYLHNQRVDTGCLAAIAGTDAACAWHRAAFDGTTPRLPPVPSWPSPVRRSA
jgi:phosphopantetheinyl transferase